jgi:ankyrin repeat protein
MDDTSCHDHIFFATVASCCFSRARSAPTAAPMAALGITGVEPETAMLWDAVDDGDEAKARAAVAAGASTSAANRMSLTALHRASAAGSAGMATVLAAELGAPLDKPDRSGSTALAVAAGRGHEAVVSALLGLGGVLVLSTRLSDIRLRHESAQLGAACPTHSCSAQRAASAQPDRRSLLGAACSAQRTTVASRRSVVLACSAQRKTARGLGSLPCAA